MRAGGSYGGLGGIGFQSGSASNNIYGDYRNPAQFGSGGANGGYGGGLVRILADSFILDGSILAKGQDAGSGNISASGTESQGQKSQGQVLNYKVFEQP